MLTYEPRTGPLTARARETRNGLRAEFKDFFFLSLFPPNCEGPTGQLASNSLVYGAQYHRALAAVCRSEIVKAPQRPRDPDVRRAITWQNRIVCFLLLYNTRKQKGKRRCRNPQKNCVDAYRGIWRDGATVIADPAQKVRKKKRKKSDSIKRKPEKQINVIVGASTLNQGRI